MTKIVHPDETLNIYYRVSEDTEELKNIVHIEKDGEEENISDLPDLQNTKIIQWSPDSKHEDKTFEFEIDGFGTQKIRVTDISESIIVDWGDKNDSYEFFDVTWYGALEGTNVDKEPHAWQNALNDSESTTFNYENGPFNDHTTSHKNISYDGGDWAARSYYGNSGSSNDRTGAMYFELTSVDVSEIENMTLWHKNQNGSNSFTGVGINEESVFTANSTDGWTKETIDFNSETGNVNIQIGSTYGSRSGSGEIYIGGIKFS